MSYDLTGVRLGPQETIDDALERLEVEAIDDAPPTDEQWRQMVAIADQCAAVDPSAQRSEDRKRGVIELSNERFGVSVFAGECGVQVPYWTDGGADDPVARQVMPYLRIFRAAGFTIFDPQADQIITDDTALADSYATSAGAVLPALNLIGGPRAPERPRKRRWPFRR